MIMNNKMGKSGSLNTKNLRIEFLLLLVVLPLFWASYKFIGNEILKIIALSVLAIVFISTDIYLLRRNRGDSRKFYGVRLLSKILALIVVGLLFFYL